MLSANDLYPTRGEQERLTERKDPILHGLDYCHKKLSDPQITDYERNGFIIVPSVFSAAEVACINRELKRLKQLANIEKKRYWRREIPAGESESLFAPERTTTLFRNLARDRRILDRVQHIVGSPVYLHRSRIHIEDKVNGTAYPWHSEFETWHAEDGVPRMRGVEVWLMLSPSTPTNGAFRMLAKSHHIYAACQGSKLKTGNGNGHSMHGLSRPSFETLTRLFYFGELAKAYGEPGTLVICDSNLMYGSSRNAEANPHVTAMLSYNSMENRPVGRPFAARHLRPSPLVNHEIEALKPQSFNFEQDDDSGTAKRPPLHTRRREPEYGYADA